MKNISFASDVPQSVKDAFAMASNLVPLTNRWISRFDTVNVSMGKPWENPEGESAETLIDTREVRVYMDDIEKDDGEWKIKQTLAPAGGLDLLYHTIMHEWMHVVDMRPYTMQEMLYGNTPPTYPSRLGWLSSYAIIGGEREAWAEAGTEYFGTHGTTTNPVALWYAHKAAWEVAKPVTIEKWDFRSDWTNEKVDDILFDRYGPCIYTGTC